MGNFRSNSKNRFVKSGDGKFRGSRKFKGNDSRRPEKRTLKMHDVICDKCKKECQVPFKPTGDKPVYCSDCFRKDESPRYNSRNQDTSFKSSMSSEEFEQINAKLDKIIQALDIDSEEDERQND
ncbi:MAG TPA: CxxC-x17-CxxC domain-containing protein [Candidatus Nanoarchaeia archaeon]|nr:CxxC-x17-CxxC domain-containing protein [Candidatus Nanoarchaeia archaeon]